MCTVAFPHSVWFRHSELWFHSAQGTKSSSWTCQWKEAVGPRGDFTWILDLWERNGVLTIKDWGLNMVTTSLK